MKKVLIMSKMLVLLTSVLLILGCGGGSGSSTSETPKSSTTTDTEWSPSPGVSPDEPIPAGMGRVVIDFSGEQAQSALITAQAGLITTAQAVDCALGCGRAVVSRSGEIPCWNELTEEDCTHFGRLYQNVIDVPMGETGFMLVPGGTDYQVDVLTFIGNVLHVAEKYGQANNVTINPGQNNSVTITLNSIQATLNVPNQIESGLTYDLRKDNPWPIRNDESKVRYSFSNDPTTFTGTASQTDAFIAPSPIESIVPLYLQGEFYIDVNLLTNTEIEMAQQHTWTYFNSQPTQITPPTTLEIIVQ